MKITLLSVPPSETNGWGRYTLELIRELAQRGLALSLITSTDCPALDLPLKAVHRILPSLMKPHRGDTFRLFAANPTVQRLTRDADVVHSMVEPYQLATLMTQKPLMVTAHGTYLPFTVKRKGWGLLYQRAYRRSQVICVSQYTQRQVEAVLPGVSTTMMHSGVALTGLLPPQPQTPPVLLTIGQLKPRKGHHILLKAFPQIVAAIPGVQMVWLGDDSDLGYVGELRKEIEAHGWQAQVRIMGRVTESEKRRWLSEATLFAMPAIEAEGKFEGFGLVYLEASAAGLPVIGTRGTAVEEAIRDGETGVLVPVSDPVALATAAIQLLRDEGMRQRMGGAGQRFAASLTWGNTADQLVRVYESQISQKEATK